MNETVANKTSTARIVYILYLVGIVFFIASIIGVVMAYVYIGDAPKWIKMHYQFQIRTFWIGVLYALIGVVLILPIFGVISLLIFGLLWVVWIIVRCVKGIKLLDRKKFHPKSDRMDVLKAPNQSLQPTANPLRGLSAAELGR